jgi:hypothetical protein
MNTMSPSLYSAGVPAETFSPINTKTSNKNTFFISFFLIIEFSRRKFTNSARPGEINTVALYETAGLLYEHANLCLLPVLPSNGTHAFAHQKHRFRPLEQMLASDRRKPRKKLSFPARSVGIYLTNILKVP